MVENLGPLGDVSGRIHDIFGSKQCGTSGPGSIIIDTEPEELEQPISDEDVATDNVDNVSVADDNGVNVEKGSSSSNSDDDDLLSELLSSTNCVLSNAPKSTVRFASLMSPDDDALMDSLIS